MAMDDESQIAEDFGMMVRMVTGASMQLRENQLRARAMQVQSVQRADTEEARVRALAAWATTTASGDVQRVVRSMEVQYEAPVVYAGPEVTARVWILRIGRTSFTLRHELWQDGRRCVLCDAVFVQVDPAAGRPVAVSDEERAAFERVLIPAED